MEFILDLTCFIRFIRSERKRKPEAPGRDCHSAIATTLLRIVYEFVRGDIEADTEVVIHGAVELFGGGGTLA